MNLPVAGGLLCFEQSALSTCTGLTVRGLGARRIFECSPNPEGLTLRPLIKGRIWGEDSRNSLRWPLYRWLTRWRRLSEFPEGRLIPRIFARCVVFVKLLPFPLAVAGASGQEFRGFLPSLWTRQVRMLTMGVLPPSRGNRAKQKSRAFHSNECPSATRGIAAGVTFASFSSEIPRLTGQSFLIFRLW